MSTMFQLKFPSTTILSGPSQSGKSSLIRQIIKNNLYEEKPQKVKWCYTYPSKWFLEEPNFTFIQGLPDKYESGDLIILDDFMHALNDKIADLFTAASHHCNVSVILVLQNIFPRSSVMRDISLNSHYIILFKNSRDMNQIGTLCRQIYPQKSKFMLSAFIKAVSKPYNYLVVDLHPLTKEEYRLRDSLFPDSRGLYWIYRPIS